MANIRDCRDDCVVNVLATQVQGLEFGTSTGTYNWVGKVADYNTSVQEVEIEELWDNLAGQG